MGEANIAAHDMLVDRGGDFGSGHSPATHTTWDKAPELNLPIEVLFRLKPRPVLENASNTIWLHATLYWGGEKQHSYKRNVSHVYERAPGSFL